MVSYELQTCASSDDTVDTIQETKINEIHENITQTKFDRKNGKAAKKKGSKYNETSQLNDKTYDVLMMEAAQQLAKRFGEDPDPPPLGEPVTYGPDRNDFVRAVFTILFVMLALTAGFLLLVFCIPPLKHFYLRVPLFVLILAMITIVAINYILSCVPSARVGCCSYVCLLIAVIAMSNVAAAVTVRYRTHIIAYALVATAVTVLVCVLLACSKFDFTKFYIYLIAAAVVFMTVSAVVAVAMLVYGVRYKPVHLVLLFVGALLNVAFIIMELQMVLGGRSVELTEREHAFGAYLLYTSIIDLFLRIVQILGYTVE